jgi:predicted O-methyltransferase YrrM
LREGDLGRFREGVSDFVKRSSWFIYSRLQENLRRNLTYEALWRRSAEDSAEFIEQNFDDAVIFQHRADFWKYVLGKMPDAGEIIEVGVFQGVSVNWIGDHLKSKKDPRLVHGFDSFEGLEEDWSGEGLASGYFQQGGILPKVRDNVRLHKGWVQDTLGPFYAEKNKPPIALIHIDTDTYTPARHILEISKPLLTEGTIIVFDELVGYPNWRSHEFKALQETLDRKSYRFIGFTSRQAALRIGR